MPLDLDAGPSNGAGGGAGLGVHVLERATAQLNHLKSEGNIMPGILILSLSLSPLPPTS